MNNNKKKGLGVVDLFTLGFGAIVGVGWSVTLNNLFINGGGPLQAAVGFIIATIIFIPIALCFGELTSMYPKAGGLVIYAREAFHKPLVSFIAGWFVAMAFISILPWESININQVLGYAFPALREGPVLYVMTGEPIYLRSSVVGLVTALVIFYLNWRGTESSALFQKITTFTLICGSAICVIFCLARLDLSNLQPLYSTMEGKQHTNMFTGILTVLALAPFFFSGFDTIPQSAEEAKSVKRSSLGLVMIAAMVFAGLFYVLIFISSGLAYPWLDTVAMPRPTLSNLFLVLYPGVLGKILYAVCTIATVAGLFSTWNGFYLGASYLMLGMSREGLLPKAFSRIHKKHGTPYVCNLFCGALMLLGPFLSVNVIDPLTTLSSAGHVIGWGIVCLSAAKLRKRAPELDRPYKMPGGRKMAIFAFIVCIFIFLDCIVPPLPGYMGPIGMWAFAAWTVLGVIFFLICRKGNNS